MDSGIWTALIAIALGTFAMRVVPLLYMRRLLESGAENRESAMPLWLRVLGPTMIGAMLGTSLVPGHAGNAASWLATAAGLLATYAVWKKTASLGWPILAGVAAYGVTKILAETAAGMW